MGMVLTMKLNNAKQVKSGSTGREGLSRDNLMN